MLPRILEPEVMDTPDEAADYDAMDHSEVNQRFVTDWMAFLQSDGPQPRENRENCLDVGTGTALIPIELCRRDPEVVVVGIDLSFEMLRLGRRRIAHAGLSQRIALQAVDAKRLPYSDQSFSAVISNSIVHHIPQPGQVLAEMTRVLRPGGLLFIRDLARPETAEAVEELVRRYAGRESPRQQQLFRQSLHAALTCDEVAGLAVQAGWRPAAVNMTSDRHWTFAAKKT